VSDCIIDFKKKKLFIDPRDIGIIVQLGRRIRSVPVMELPQRIAEGDCLCTNSVISFSVESPDLGNWRSALGRAPKQVQYWWYDYIGSAGIQEPYLLLA
jgi:hypothetical protein